MDTEPPVGSAPPRREWPVALAALGVVFGDIGTSPLYAFRECFGGPHAMAAGPAALAGAASLVVWTLVVVVSVKYLAFILRLDNKGEGGILALAALVRSAGGPAAGGTARLFALGIFGATLIYADGVLTPAISVLSAVEGLSVDAAGLQHFIVPVAVAILVGLFAIQRFGTGRVGAMFGPAWVLPLTALATAAAIIASQALISGAFSLTSQAIQFGCLPRMGVLHTSATAKGQIYIPFVNWALMAACVALVLGFRSSSALAGAYGVAIALTMTVTSLLFHAAARRIWGWNRWQAGVVAGGFVVVDAAFLAANSLKLFHGGLIPLAISAALLCVIGTWRWGRERVRRRLEKLSMPVELLVEEVARKRIQRVAGAAVFMSGKRSGVPTSLLHNLKHNHILHQRVLLLHVETLNTPAATGAERVVVEELGEGIHFVHLRFGFSETPDVPAALKAHLPAAMRYDQGHTTFFLGRESYAVARDTRGLNRLRLALFAVLSRNATPATAYFRLPPSRVVELGAQLTV